MTDKQCNTEKRDAKACVIDMKITLEYSIKLLEDYRGDLKIELQDLTKTIKSAKNKLKKLDEKLKG
jgi:hypothetical protein